MRNSYDEALFKQILRKKQTQNGFILSSDIEEAFWKVCWDLEVAIEQQKPEKMEEAKAAFQRDMLPIFMDMLQADGFEVVQEED